MKADYWFTSPEGIKAHYAEQREQADEDYKRKVKRINDDENNMLDALANTRALKKD